MKEWRVERTEERADGLRKTSILMNPKPTPLMLPSSTVFSLCLFFHRMHDRVCHCVKVCSSVCICMCERVYVYLEALDVAVSLQRGEQDVEEPEADEKHGGQHFSSPWTPQLTADVGSAAVHEHPHTDKGENGEEGDGESQATWLHPEFMALWVVVDGGDGPGHSDAQEDVDGVTARHVSNGRVGVLILCRCHFTGKSVWKKDDRRKRKKRDRGEIEVLV